MSSPKPTQLIPAERVEKLIHLARGERGLLDADLAGLYGVTTTRPSNPSSTPSANSWLRPASRNARSAFTRSAESLPRPVRRNPGTNETLGMSSEAFPYDVFLSHSPKGKAAVRDVWFDEWALRPSDSIE